MFIIVLQCHNSLSLCQRKYLQYYNYSAMPAHLCNAPRKRVDRFLSTNPLVVVICPHFHILSCPQDGFRRYLSDTLKRWPQALP
jgi:hypothetical protein